MLKKLRLERFKNFREAELELGPFTILVGTNASGKSNIGDALRFLHGIGRGYNIAEILGEKWGDGGIFQWSGIRGGKQNISFQNCESFALEITLDLFNQGIRQEVVYRIEVVPGDHKKPPEVRSESLHLIGELYPLFNFSSQPENGQLILQVFDQNITTNNIKDYNLNDPPILKRMESFFHFNFPILTDLSKHENLSDVRLHDWPKNSLIIRQIIKKLFALRILNLAPEKMCLPSYPGQNTLGDRGENLSSVLQAICKNDQDKETVLEWLKALTPMDAIDLEFVEDLTGKILLRLIESNGQKIPAFSASDGTLRFLGTIAALLSNQTNLNDNDDFQLFFLEELENGIHPTRLHLLIQLIESCVQQQKLQMITTTHSPQMLRLLSDETLKNVSLIYRLENQPDAKIKRILDISPETKDLIKTQSLGRLHESGWLENMMEFSQED